MQSNGVGKGLNEMPGSVSTGMGEGGSATNTQPGRFQLNAANTN